MFTGFASENTPAIQVWDFSKTFASATANRDIALTDDCAPIQVVLTGGGTSATINIFLPTAPIEGRQIKIVNKSYGPNAGLVFIKSSDSNFGTSANIVGLGVGQTIDLCYSKYFVSITGGSALRSGWVALNQNSDTSLARSSIVLGTGSNATGEYSAVIGGVTNLSSNGNAAVVGGSNNTASGSGAAVVGGSSNTASQTSAAIVGGSGNQAQSTRAFIGGGQNGTAQGSNSAVIGGSSNYAANAGDFVAGGSGNTASGSNSAVVGGQSNTASGGDSAVIGGTYGTTRSIAGNFVTPASSNPITGASGRTQTAILLLGRETTDATATRLTSNTSAASTTNQVILPNNSAYTFQGTCVANVTGGGNTSGWKFEGVIKRGANAASTALVAAVTPTVIAQDAGASTWVLAITADTTNGGIAVTVTGQAATTIRWVAKIETTEVTF